MLITLTRTGGLIPMTKQAEKEVDWSEQEMKQLLEVIKDEEGPGQKRDASGYELKYKGGTFSIDIEKVPPPYKNTFDDLKQNMQIVKR